MAYVVMALRYHCQMAQPLPYFALGRFDHHGRKIVVRHKYTTRRHAHVHQAWRAGLVSLRWQRSILLGGGSELAYTVMAYKVMAYIVMAYMVMACIVMAYIVMTHTVMAYIVMAYNDVIQWVLTCAALSPLRRTRLYTCLYTCLYTSFYICLYTSLYTYLYTCLDICLYTCLCICLYACLYICLCK